MSYKDQMTAIGASNYALLKNKIVTWGEIVTKYRVRTLREVISLNKVSLKTAIKAGVPKRAYVAWDEAFRPRRKRLAPTRAHLIENIKGAGVSQEALVDALTRGLVSRVELVAPLVEQSMAPFVAQRTGDLLAGELAAIAAEALAAKVGLLPGEHHPDQFELPTRGPKRPTPGEPEKPDEPEPPPAPRNPSRRPNRNCRRSRKRSRTSTWFAPWGVPPGAQLTKDATGKEWVMKSGANAGHLKEEAIADDLYRALNVDVPRSKIYDVAGKPVKLSEFHQGTTLGSLEHSDPADARSRNSRKTSYPTRSWATGT